MQVTLKVREILSNYESDNPGTKTNLARILMAGRLGGTGKVLILPVDQGFEHGPDRSFASNPVAYDPCYHFGIAVEAGLNAYAAPLGMLEAGASKYAGAIPLILKVNSANSFRSSSSHPDQAITGNVKDALRLGCSAIGFTIYPGSENMYEMMEEISYMAQEAKEAGLAVIVWSYARGGDLTTDDETAIDTISYAAHMAALLGAHIIKVKPPTIKVNSIHCKKIFDGQRYNNLSERIAHVKKACFDGKRLVVFSGGGAKDLDSLYTEISQVAKGGGDGSIIGRNTFTRPREEALKMLNKIVNIYTGA